MDLIGGVNSQGDYVLKILYVNMKESGPLGRGVSWACPLDLPMCFITNVYH